jgi:hypothetical protein
MMPQGYFGPWGFFINKIEKHRYDDEKEFKGLNSFETRWGFHFESGEFDARDFIVIVNMNSPLKDADMEVIKEVYLGEKKFAGSTRFLPVNFTEGPIKELQ